MPLSARRALLLFHERDLAEMKPTDVITPFLASIQFVSARHNFAALRIIIAGMIFCLDFSPATEKFSFPFVSVTYDVSALHFCAVRFAAISHGSIRPSLPI